MGILPAGHVERVLGLCVYVCVDETCACACECFGPASPHRPLSKEYKTVLVNDLPSYTEASPLAGLDRNAAFPANEPRAWRGPAPGPK